MSESCLACGSKNISQCLNLGLQPLANEFKYTAEEPENVYPLGVMLCSDCFHLQLDYFIDPDLMFKNYLYVSGTSQTYRKYLEWFAQYTGVRNGMKVLDIGCNDGTQLDAFKKLGAETWGIDPAMNLYPISSEKHNVTLGYFDEKYNPGFTFNIINAQNVFAHNRDPVGFLRHCKTIMNDSSKLYIQTSQADMVLNGEFDTIYHEHINFFNVNSFKKLTERAGLVLIDVNKTPIHGTSYMFTIAISGLPTSNVSTQVKNELDSNLYDIVTYTHWVNNIMSAKSIIREALDGKFVVAYGAAAKGNTLLNFIGVKPQVIIDDNPKKHGTYSPGVKSPIVSIDWLETLTPTVRVTFLPLAWNLFDEIKSNIKKVRNNTFDDFFDIRDALKRVS
jgi:SAM-dependent methyltransferase